MGLDDYGKEFLEFLENGDRNSTIDYYRVKKDQIKSAVFHYLDTRTTDREFTRDIGMELVNKFDILIEDAKTKVDHIIQDYIFRTKPWEEILNYRDRFHIYTLKTVGSLFHRGDLELITRYQEETRPFCYPEVQAGLQAWLKYDRGERIPLEWIIQKGWHALRHQLKTILNIVKLEDDELKDQFLSNVTVQDFLLSIDGITEWENPGELLKYHFKKMDVSKADIKFYITNQELQTSLITYFFLEYDDMHLEDLTNSNTRAYAQALRRCTREQHHDFWRRYAREYAIQDGEPNDYALAWLYPVLIEDMGLGIDTCDLIEEILHEYPSTREFLRHSFLDYNIGEGLKCQKLVDLFLRLLGGGFLMIWVFRGDYESFDLVKKTCLATHTPEELMAEIMVQDIENGTLASCRDAASYYNRIVAEGWVEYCSREFLVKAYYGIVRSHGAAQKSRKFCTRHPEFIENMAPDEHIVAISMAITSWGCSIEFVEEMEERHLVHLDQEHPDGCYICHFKLPVNVYIDDALIEKLLDNPRYQIENFLDARHWHSWQQQSTAVLLKKSSEPGRHLTSLCRVIANVLVANEQDSDEHYFIKEFLESVREYLFKDLTLDDFLRESELDFSRCHSEYLAEILDKIFPREPSILHDGVVITLSYVGIDEEYMICLGDNLYCFRAIELTGDERKEIIATLESKLGNAPSKSARK